MSRLSPGFRADSRPVTLDRSTSAEFAPAVNPQKRNRNTEVSETAKLLLAGGVAGATSKSATAPLARLTILYQVALLCTLMFVGCRSNWHRSSPLMVILPVLFWSVTKVVASAPQVKGLQTTTGHIHKASLQQTVQQIIQREGARALWKGNGVTMLHRLPYSAVNFWAYEQFTKQWHLSFPKANKSQDAVLRRLAAGGAAGMLACTLVCNMPCAI